MKISERKLNGIVYTPNWIVQLILDKLNYNENIYGKKIIDPACGDGAFLKEVAGRFIINAKQKSINDSEIKKAIQENI